MKARVIIRTPAGQAKKAESNLRKLLIGQNKFNSVDTYVSHNDDEVAWEVEGDPRTVIKLTQNITKFDWMMSSILKNKHIKKMYTSKLSANELEALDNMLLRQTEVQVIKEAIAEELVEANKTFWQRIKERWTKQ